MSAIMKPTPRGRQLGIDDRSRRTQPLEPEMIPTHLPHMYLLTERGGTLPKIVVGASRDSLYGAASFDPLGKFTTHQTLLANLINSNANACMIQRLKPADAETAMIRLGVEVIKDEITLYERDSNGQYITDGSGNYVDRDDGAGGSDTRNGYKLRWVVIASQDPIGEVAAAGGTMTSTLNGESSTIYPVIDAVVSSFGSYGNRVGLRMWAPTEASQSQVDTDLALQLKAYPYRFQLVERPDGESTAVIKRSVFDETVLDAVLPQDMIHPTRGTEHSLDTVMVDRFQQIEPGQAEVHAPFGQIHVYQDNIETVLELLRSGDSLNGNTAEGEADYEDEAVLDFGGRDIDYTDVSNLHLINFLTGVDLKGAPHYAFQIENTPGIVFTQHTTTYASGGDDGDISLENYDALVRTELLNYGDLEAKMLNRAKYPASAYYDSGFSMDTKIAFATPIGRRKDVAAFVSTQELWGYNVSEEWVKKPINDIATESENVSILASALRNAPEAEIFGTNTVRAMIVGHSGKMINSPYKGYLPLTFDIANGLANYMGAANGRWQSGQNPTENPNNIVSLFKDINITYKPDSVYDNNWDAGLTYVQDYDTRSVFWPAWQTVYDDPTSVLNSAITMLACVELQKVTDRAWRQLVGDTRLTPGQFSERSDLLIESMVRGKFDQLFIVEPETTITGADAERGFSWSTTIRIFANTMRLVGTFTIESYRMEDAA